MTPIFESLRFGASEKSQLDRDGHILLPGLLTSDTRERLIAALDRIDSLPPSADPKPACYSAEYEDSLASVIAHPQMLELAHAVLGETIRFDHCVSLTRRGGDPGQGWHVHSYADDRPELGFIRIFFYINGFLPGDGGLKVVPGSHLFRQGRLGANSDEKLRADWIGGKVHPGTGEPLEILELEAPPGSVIVMWTHALHAVSPRCADSATRWTVVYAYRNPGEHSHARWITPAFERNPPAGAKELMGLDLTESAAD